MSHRMLLEVECQPFNSSYMGKGVTAHGVIEPPGWGKQARSVRVFRHSRAVIRSLPPIDPDSVSYFFSANRYSCCASRRVRVRRPSLSSITKDKPMKPGTIVTNAVVPSSFLPQATPHFHSPQPKQASAPPP